jgi:uncharacterized protein (TIGR02001 family)
MNRLIAVAATSCLLSPLGAQAIELTPDLNLTVGLGVFSEYRSLGISQTQGNPALQMDATLLHSSGFLLGLWSSNVDDGNLTKVYREDGYSAGYYHDFSDKVNVFVSLSRYEYPKQAAYDTNEIYAVANAYGFRAGYIYDFDVKDLPNLQGYFAGYNFSLPYETNLYVKYGLTDYNFDIVSSSGNTRRTYNDWEATLTKKVFGVDWTLSYVDTDLSKGECMYLAGKDDLCSAGLIVGARKVF